MFSRTCAVVPRRSMWIGIYLFVCQCTYPHGYGCEGRRHRFKYASRIPMFLIAGPPVGLSCPRPSQLRAPEGTFQPWPGGKLSSGFPKECRNFLGGRPSRSWPSRCAERRMSRQCGPRGNVPRGGGRGAGRRTRVSPPCTTRD